MGMTRAHDCWTSWTVRGFSGDAACGDAACGDAACGLGVLSMGAATPPTRVRALGADVEGGGASVEPGLVEPDAAACGGGAANIAGLGAGVRCSATSALPGGP